MGTFPNFGFSLWGKEPEEFSSDRLLGHSFSKRAIRSYRNQQYRSYPLSHHDYPKSPEEVYANDNLSG